MQGADAVARISIESYAAPNLTMEDMRTNSIERHVDPLRDFSEACREELRTFGRY